MGNPLPWYRKWLWIVMGILAAIGAAFLTTRRRSITSKTQFRTALQAELDAIDKAKRLADYQEIYGHKAALERVKLDHHHTLAAIAKLDQLRVQELAHDPVALAKYATSVANRNAALHGK